MLQINEKLEWLSLFSKHSALNLQKLPHMKQDELNYHARRIITEHEGINHSDEKRMRTQSVVCKK